MKKVSVVLTTLAILLSLMTQSCKKEDSVSSTELNKNGTPPTLRAVQGVKFLSESQYNSVPKATATTLKSLNGDVQLRSSYLKLPTHPIGDQGGEGSCTAFAMGYAGLSYLLHVVEGMPYTNTGALRSAEFLYNTTKLPGSCRDAGSHMTKVLDALIAKGTCSVSEMPYNDTDCSTLPNTTQKVAAARARLGQYFSLDASDVKYCLTRGYPIAMAFCVDTNWDAQTSSPPFIYKRAGGEIRGGHAVLICGYDDSKQAFIVQNSWGTGYHDKGFFYISYELFPSIAKELYIMVPQPTQTVHKHTTNSENIISNWTTLNSELANNNPNALVFVTSDYGNGPFHNKSVGIWYDSDRWNIFNQDRTAMGVKSKFNVLVVNPSDNAFIHTASQSTLTGHITYLNHPSLNNNPDAKFLISQRWEGTYNNNPVGIYYHIPNKKWSIYNQNLAAMPQNAKFNVLIQNDIFEITATTPTGNFYSFDNTRTNDRANVLLFTTQLWKGVYNPTEIGVWFTNRKWSIFNQNQKAMPLNSKFFVLPL